MTYPDWLVQDIRIIIQMSFVSNLVHTSANGCVEVCFDLAYDEYAQANYERLQNPEPVKLRYQLSKFPSEPEFLSSRHTFPRSLPHLNPVARSHPVSICLWRKGGNSALYFQRGIAACLNVLKGWFEDASLETLEHDGWEPSPRGGVISFNINLGIWQELAVKSKCSGKIISSSSHVLIEKFDNKSQFGWVLPETKVKEHQNNRDFLRPLKYGEVSKIRTYFLVPDENFVENEHCSLKLDSFDNLRAYSKHAQLAQAVDFIQSCKKPKGVSAAVLAIVQRRPISLVKEIPSLSKNDCASKLEITAILVLHDSNDYSFHELQIKSPATSELLASISGTDVIDRELSILGCGSIGSAICDFLIRAGHKRFSLWDDDVFEAHNNARHVLHQKALERAFAALDFKVGKMKARMEEINSEVQVRDFRRRFDSQQVSKLRNSTHIIDATGEAVEPLWLDDLKVPYTKVFIADMGSLAFLLTLVPNDIADVLDLEAALFSLASRDECIRGWLNNESQLSDKMLGLSCSSATMEMPWFKVSNHVSALMPTLLQQVKSPSTCLAMNVLDHEGNPRGLTKFDLEVGNFKFQQKKVDDDKGETWTITFSQLVLDKVREIRQNHQPSEAAGYLLGLYNINTKRISIVVATEGKFDSSSTSATLESIEQDSEAQKALTDTNYMLKPLGTWHSHPGQSAEPSNRDLSTFSELVNNVERTLPSVMMICAESAINFLVGINRTI